MKNGEAKYLAIYIITTILFLICIPSTSYACSCVEPNSVKEEFKQSSAVFSGKAIKIVDKNKSMFGQSSADFLAVVFEVDDSWKGIDQKQVVVYTERSSASCGFEFTLNNNYLVYAYEVDGQLRVSLCSRTSPLSEATKDLEELGKGETPTKQASIDLQNDNSLYNNWILSPLLFIALLLVGVYIRQRTKK